MKKRVSYKPAPGKRAESRSTEEKKDRPAPSSFDKRRAEPSAEKPDWKKEKTAKTGDFKKKFTGKGRDERPFEKFYDVTTKRALEKSGERPSSTSSDRPFDKTRKKSNDEFARNKKEDFRPEKKNFEKRGAFSDRPKKIDKPTAPVVFVEAPVMKDEMRLNKFISNAGICSRRKADEHIKEGSVTVNGQIILEMGYKVQPGDKVYFKGERVVNEKKVYVLLNKPKDFITTTDDEKGRKTVMDLVKKAADVRLYPVGRLDRNTTGLLLMTNDGELTQKLSHPSSNVIKVYQAELDKPITQAHLEEIRKGINLEDGIANVDEIDITEPKVDAHFVGVAIHSGKNRIVRRIFEHLGYQVVRLDRVAYSGLTKKDLGRGHWRYLTRQELIFLKHLTGGSKKQHGNNEEE